MNGRPWSAMDIAWLTALYPDLRGIDVAFALGRPLSGVYRMADYCDVSKSAEFNASDLAARISRGRLIGAASAFHKGHIPHNKGKKGVHYAGSEKGWFPKGHQRSDTAAYGAERIDSQDGYVLVKVPPDIQGKKALPWQPKHRVLWEAANGPIPKGMVLKCLGDKLNCDPSNWELITLAENMKRNTIHNYPPAIVEVTMLRGAINRRLNGLKRRNAHDEERLD